MNSIKRVKLVGSLILVGMIAGIFSVAPAVDSVNYLTDAAANANETIIAAIFQFIMSLTYIGMAILLYPIIQQFSRSFSIGFLSFRIIAVTLSIIGTVLLISILVLSEAFVKNPNQDILVIESIGNVLKTSRDYINHVFMVFMLCIGNIWLYFLVFKTSLIPKWLSLWGIVGSTLSILASIMVLFQIVDIITPSYLILNAPTAIMELILGIWLMIKGFDNQIVKDSI